MSSKNGPQDQNSTQFFPNVLKSNDLSYDSYLKITELTSLQKPESQPPHHDEMLFIIIHQAFELWFKLMKHELDLAMKFMCNKEALQAAHTIQRCSRILSSLIGQLHLLETMTPHDFLQFRDRLNPASGFQSIQFRQLEYAMGLKDASYLKYFANRPEQAARLKQQFEQKDLTQCFFIMLHDLGYAVGAGENTDKIREQLLKIYSHRAQHLPIYLAAEAMIELDETFCLWRDHHVRVVERIIGYKMGTGGSKGVEYLRSVTQRKAFPYLWEVRTYLQKD